MTRWGTWLKATDYYAHNLIEVKKIVNEFFDGDGILMKQAKEAVNDVVFYVTHSPFSRG